MAGNMFIPPQNRSNPMVNMGMNFLSQLAMAKVAHQWQMEEMDRKLEAAKILKDQELAFSKEMADQPLKVTDVDVGGSEPAKIVYHPGTKQLLQVKGPKEAAEEKQPTSFKEYTLAKNDGFQGSYSDWMKFRATASMDPNKARDQELQELGATNQLSNEFNQRSKEFLTVRDAYNRVKVSAQEPSAAGDMAMIFNYMKMLDPGSTVREGEFATAQNAASVPELIRAQYNKIINGERLTDITRGDFLKRASMLYGAQEKTHKQLREEFTQKAQRWRLNPQDIVTDYLTQPEKQSIPSSTPRTGKASKIELTPEQQALYKKYGIPLPE